MLIYMIILSVTVETPNLDSEQDFPQQVASSPTVWIASSPPTQGPWSNAGRGIAEYTVVQNLVNI
jgi:hypothetical protein